MRSIIILCLILLSGSLKLTPKICVNCKHFINDEISGPEFGKCREFPLESVKYLIDGVIRNDEYRYCSTARNQEQLCGKSGKKYSKSRKSVKKIANE
jgi:hypothetical protein